MKTPSRWALVIGLAGVLAAVAGCGGDEGEPGPSLGASSGNVAAGTVANGDPCTDTSGVECESGVCFAGGRQTFCTVRCTAENQTEVCVAPLTGSCNRQGYCKRD
ncbi:MAG: hypothetical protein KIT84_29270 [Labilithrix sp.]|nr:hypothetical protein [Labilithrix sp.]MCW5815153.1 hypothetical protein [Labilithrix sp.]